MAKRSSNDDGVRRLAAQLGLEQHIISAENSPANSPADRGVNSEAKRAENEDDDEDDAMSADEEDPGELSVGFELSDSVSEELSSDLSLPLSLGRYDGTRPAVSQFDDHLAPRAPIGPSGSPAASEALMKKFFEAQVGRVRAQLVLSTQTQRELERTLREERAEAAAKLEALQISLKDESRKLQRENEEMHRENDELMRRLHFEKQHMTNLEVSDELAAQLSQQQLEDLSLREYVQLQVHTKVRKLEKELEMKCQELEATRAALATSEKTAHEALNGLQQARDAAETKERRLQHDLELADATRKELETQLSVVYSELDELKSEREQHDAQYRNQRQLLGNYEALNTKLNHTIEERDTLREEIARMKKEKYESDQKCTLLTADKSFLLEAKSQLESDMGALRARLRDLEAQKDDLQQKYDATYGQSLVLQSETRLQFEKKLDEEMRKFMDVSKQEIERIRTNAQVVFERENRLLKDARDSALQQVETLEARLQAVQSRLDEQVLERTRLESEHSAALASARNELKMRHFEMSQLQVSMEEKTTELRSLRLEVEMLTQKVSIHKDEFSRLETTSSTKIAQLEASLELERSKLKEYELLEVDLDNAVLQTGEALAANTENEAVQQTMTTFGAIPTTTKRRFEQSVQLAQKVVKGQREVLALSSQLKEANNEKVRLERYVATLTDRLNNLHQPQAYLIDKLTRREQELQAMSQRAAATDQQLQELRDELREVVDARNSLQRQLQTLLARRQDIDTLKSTVLALRARLEFESDRVASKRSISPVESAVKAPPSPAPPIASRMTQSPASSSRGCPEVSGDASPPKWYTKLRS